jgi:hypothetical protein
MSGVVIIALAYQAWYIAYEPRLPTTKAPSSLIHPSLVELRGSRFAKQKARLAPNPNPDSA